MSDTTTQTDPRERIRVLMRGDRAGRREGLMGPAATLAVCKELGITVEESADEALALLAYAYGYAVGLNRDWLTVDWLCDSHAVMVRQGYEDGMGTEAVQTLPAPVGRPGDWDGTR